MTTWAPGDVQSHRALLFLSWFGSCLGPAAGLLSMPSHKDVPSPATEARWEKVQLDRRDEAQLDRERIVRDLDEDEEVFPPGPWRNDYKAAERFPAALRHIMDTTPTKAAVLYVQLGQWPPYIHYVVQSAAANNATTFYFIGPPFKEEELDDCDNCMWLPFDLGFAKTRIETFLGVPEEYLTHLYPTKLCDLKPMWPTLFPEISDRHDWIGFADHDIIFGDLDSEIAAVPENAELLVPKGFFPQPLANGNFMLFRTTPKMLHAFKAASNWERVIRDHQYLGFDEWWGVQPSMMEVLVKMHLDGKLKAKPTLRPLIQDFTVTHDGGLIGAGVDQNATTDIYWHKGNLVAKRYGMCVCPIANTQAFAFMPLSGCTECARQPQGGLLPEVTLNRTIQALGFHFQAWKKKKAWKDCSFNCDGWMPTCRRKGFHFSVRGFSCWGGPRPTQPPPKVEYQFAHRQQEQIHVQEVEKPSEYNNAVQLARSKEHLEEHQEERHEAKRTPLGWVTKTWRKIFYHAE